MSDVNRLRVRLDVERGASFDIFVDGVTVPAHAGESVAAAMLVAGKTGTRRSPRLAQLRSYFCGMGVCWECLVRIDDTYLERACMQRVRPGMRVKTETEGCE